MVLSAFEQMLLLRAIFIVCTLSAVYANNTVDNLPCDIFKEAGTPCVAAHSTVRALYKSFSGSLYSVRRQKDDKSLDIGVKTVGGFANSTAQDLFCQGDLCVFDRIYDQSPNQNHLGIAPPGGAHGNKIFLLLQTLGHLQ